MSRLHKHLFSCATESFQAAKNILFPCRCLGCGRAISGDLLLFCPDCTSDIIPVGSPLCSCCGSMFPDGAGGDHFCGECLVRPKNFTTARSIVQYTAPIARAITQFKYSGNMAVLPTFSALLAGSSWRETDVVYHLIIPVPLHVKRLQDRGFNQAGLLAKSFFPGREIAWDLLRRIKETPPQANLDGRSRRLNMRDAFQVKDGQRLQGEIVLLVDDVYTTGTTVNECARALKRAGAGRVDVLTLARA